jgi:hypothetical protein
MDNKDSIRDRILSRLPEPANAAAYRDEMASTLAKNEQRLRLEGGYSAAIMWVLAVGFITACVMKGARWLDTARGHFMEFLVVLLLIGGAVEILKHAANRSRVELLKEVKQLQLQVLELRAAMEKSGNPPGL